MFLVKVVVKVFFDIRNQLRVFPFHDKDRFKWRY